MMAAKLANAGSGVGVAVTEASNLRAIGVPASALSISNEMVLTPLVKSPVPHIGWQGVELIESAL